MWSIIQAAGWPIWPLIFASIIALALIFERLWSLRQSVVAPPGMVDRVLAEFRQARRDARAPREDRGAAARSAASSPPGLANVKAPRPVMKEAIEEVGRVVTHDLERFLTTLGTIAAMAPLLGLFGTVVGMIEIFGSQTPAGIATRSSSRTASRSRSTTRRWASSSRSRRMIFYRHFRAKIDALVVEMEQQAIKLVDFAHGERKYEAAAPRMNLRGTRQRDDPEINFIPLIDVLLVILIFLMVTTTYQRVAELQITLPEADADAGEAAAEGDQRRHRRAGPLRHRQARCSRSRPSARSPTC